MWKDLERLLTEVPEDELRTALLADIDFILEHFGEPEDYYNNTNKYLKEINKRISNIRRVGLVLCGDEFEENVLNLYRACSDNGNIKKIDIKHKAEYKKFYIYLNHALDVHYYGENASFGHHFVFTQLKDNLWLAKRLLETGRVPDSKTYDIYKQDLRVNLSSDKFDHYSQ